MKHTSTIAESQSNNDNDNRRKRINRIKTFIVIIAIIFLIIPTIFCIILGIQVNRLQKQMKELIELHSQYGLTYEEQGSINYAYGAENNTDTDDINSAYQKDSKTESITLPTIFPAITTAPIFTPTADASSNTIETTNSLTSVPTSNTDNNNIENADNVNNTDKKINPDASSKTEQVSTSDSNSNVKQSTNTKNPSKNNSSISDAILNNSEDSNNEPNSEDKKTGIKSESLNQKPKVYTGKKVYLTFDDGPSIYTDAILDILADYEIKATFFVIGKTDKESKRLYKRIVKEGHTLGMHSYSHKYDKLYNSIEDFDKDFTKLWKLLYDTTGYKPSIYRFPGGSQNLVNSTGMEDYIQYLKDASVVYFDWNVVNGDATGVTYTNEQLIQNVLDGVAVKERSIVLMHDSKTKETTVESLTGLLDELIVGGAQILPLDSNVPPIQMIKADSVH